MPKGKVKWWSEAKGFGFLTAEDGTDVFCHYTEVLGTGHKTLKEGQPVNFDIVKAPKGPRAKNIVASNGS